MSARVLMVQGTASHVGKSLVVAGILRIVAQDGRRAAPFKSQNMALNSIVTQAGAEIGRAQGMQAEAAGVEPHSDFNPILLKPTADSVAQVILDGRPIGNLTAEEYHFRKPWFLERIAASLDRLRSEYEVVVIEGAGSPAEVNLRDRDIANMAIAELADAPVVLVADIDRGGLFASVVGTVDLLRPEERARLVGLIVNKFRGTRKLLDPGLDFLRERTGLPLWGVVPHIAGLGLEEEDSVALEGAGASPSSESLDLAVIALPHISNFTDFAPLASSAGVVVRYVASPAELTGRQPDAVIVPGSKNTIDDLLWMRSRGLDDAVITLARNGIPIVGICGGYQILGRTISDPWKTESSLGRMHGLGLLHVDTELSREKTTVRARAVVAAAGGLFGMEPGTELAGYEIHAGRSRVEGTSPLRIRREKGDSSGSGSTGFAPGRQGSTGPEAVADWIPDGALDESGLIFGTYLHGLFESTAFRQGFLNFLRSRKGLPAQIEGSYRQAKEAEFDRLADVLREHLDMEALYRTIGLPRSKTVGLMAGSGAYVG